MVTLTEWKPCCFHFSSNKKFLLIWVEVITLCLKIKAKLNRNILCSLNKTNPASIYLLSFNNKNTRRIVTSVQFNNKGTKRKSNFIVVSLLITLNKCHVLFKCFYCRFFNGTSAIIRTSDCELVAIFLYVLKWLNSSLLSKTETTSGENNCLGDQKEKRH